MTRYDSATIKRARTIIANAERQEAARKAAATRTVKTEKNTDWRKKPASVGQMRRINACYKRDGLREFATIAAFRKVFTNAGMASDEFQSIKNG